MGVGRCQSPKRMLLKMDANDTWMSLRSKTSAQATSWIRLKKYPLKRSSSNTGSKVRVKAAVMANLEKVIAPSNSVGRNNSDKKPTA